MNNQQADHLTLVVWERGGLYRLPTSLDWTVREFFMRVYLKIQVYWYSCTINTENKLQKLVGEEFFDGISLFGLRRLISKVVKMKLYVGVKSVLVSGGMKPCH